MWCKSAQIPCYIADIATKSKYGLSGRPCQIRHHWSTQLDGALSNWTQNSGPAYVLMTADSSSGGTECCRKDSSIASCGTLSNALAQSKNITLIFDPLCSRKFSTWRTQHSVLAIKYVFFRRTAEACYNTAIK